MRTSRPPTSAAYETESNVRTHIDTHTHREQERKREREGNSRIFPNFPRERKRGRERKRDCIWVCLKSQASIWLLQLYGTEMEERGEMRGREERKIL